MQEGVDGLLRDKMRPPRIPPLRPEIAERAVAPTLGPSPGATMHWTAPAMATHVGISAGSVQRIWRSHGLQPQTPGLPLKRGRLPGRPATPGLAPAKEVPPQEPMTVPGDFGYLLDAACSALACWYSCSTTSPTLKLAGRCRGGNSASVLIHC